MAPVNLHIERGGTGSPMIFVHGFTQTARCWGEVAADFERDHEVVRVDAPGHGRSAAIATDLWGGADLLADVADATGPAVWIGYSMGGRFCLHAGLSHPERVRALVLIGAAGGIDDPIARAERAARDEALALTVERDGVEAFLDKWLALPMFAGLPEHAVYRAERETNTAAGLASSLRLAGTGSQEPLGPHLGRLTMPVLVTAGSLDTKFAAEAERLAIAVGKNATVALVDDAGHTAHLEQPKRFVEMVRAWLDESGL